MELEYTPTAPKQQETPKPEFVLVNDVTFKPIPNRGPQILKAVHQDEKGNPVIVQFKVPYPPKDNCKKCRGRGFIGFVSNGSEYLPNVCVKCYPVAK